MSTSTTALTKAIFTMDSVKLSTPKRFIAACLVMQNEASGLRLRASAKRIVLDLGTASQLKAIEDAKHAQTA